MTERRSASLMRYLGALALLAVGIDHIEQYYVDYYRAVPTIGTLFLLNFVSALVVSVCLVAPVRRIAGRFAGSVVTLLAIGGIAIAGGTLAGLLISENGGLFGFMEQGYRGAIVLSIAFDVAAVTFLAAFLVLRAATARGGAVLRAHTYPYRGPVPHRGMATKPKPLFDRRNGRPSSHPRKETTK
jgi:hypothetical protein